MSFMVISLSGPGEAVDDPQGAQAVPSV